MKYTVGIDLGSTTTKAVVLDDESKILGRGITNSRSNYKVACDVALGEALNSARFGLIDAELERAGVDAARRTLWLEDFDRHFREQQYRLSLRRLGETLGRHAREEADARIVVPLIDDVISAMTAETRELFSAGANRKSDFFRDLAGSRYLPIAEGFSEQRGARFDRVAGLFDKAILEVENATSDDEMFSKLARAALVEASGATRELREAVERAADIELEQACCVGTGYGRATLPFPKEWIRSEILCHGLGAHAMFPDTRTVLDIGGQDTKAIQVDDEGIVTSFQMNDRCAAGCGRYLGYIADEMNLGLHELGPMACKSKRNVKINSTCTVFAGAELRERLSLGEKREDILAGLHRAIILRAMSLLARSGGVKSEFTFTGGVARNPAAVEALRKLIFENYGEMKLNISTESIFTGALGAALFAHREARKMQAQKVPA
ncbi:MAG: benzoyl-CoA reductase subunit A [Planctomycetes bacterium]|nr:benzoyl-CoA reductase subunit A [Planctomycetota bacterium]